MRRVVMALLSTAIGTTLLVGLKARGAPGAIDVVATAPPAPGPTASAGPVAPGQSTLPGTSKPGQTTPAPGQSLASRPPSGGSTTTAPPTTVSVTGGAVAVKTAQSPSPKSKQCDACHAYSISVTITVSGGRITSASATYSNSPGESRSYADKASNSLKQRILAAQTWNLGRVSGATYSGNAWELSVKDAISKAGLPV